MRTLLPVIPFKLNEIVDTSTFSEREEERTLLPVIPFKLNEIVDTSTFSEREEERKNRNERNYNTRHRTKSLCDFEVDSVWNAS
ncbi:hypothetical protein QE152_g33941 [Popillia japonica]|uniref:Uncharacterized protein n=1 Tax=Popillia japonica TaxID=7064 RepID=A0AAW1IUR2_POPJA